MTRPSLLSAIVGLWVLGLTACGSVPIPQQHMERLFEAAIADAMQVEPSEVVQDLVVIRPGAAGLEWSDEGRVRVTTWERERWLRKPNRELTLPKEVWVTPDRVVQERCQRIDAPERELMLRLEQLLGLAPGDGAGRRFVELWVDPKDLFRPCPDPAIDRVDCSPEVDPAEIPKEHREWLAETAEEAHRPASEGGAPWTGLGYTFDWGGPYSEVGFTELVVRRSAQVWVGRVASARDYCQRSLGAPPFDKTLPDRPR